MTEMSSEFMELQKAGEKWGFRHIPQEWVDEFRETSPGNSLIIFSIVCMYM